MIGRMTIGMIRGRLRKIRYATVPRGRQPLSQGCTLRSGPRDICATRPVPGFVDWY